MTLALGLVVLVGLGSRGSATSSPVSSDPVYKALLVDGRTLEGRIVSFNPGSIMLAGTDGAGAKEELSFSRLIKLTREVASPFAGSENSQAVMLPEGDCLMRVTVGAA